MRSPLVAGCHSGRSWDLERLRHVDSQSRMRSIVPGRYTSAGRRGLCLEWTRSARSSASPSTARPTGPAIDCVAMPESLRTVTKRAMVSSHDAAYDRDAVEDRPGCRPAVDGFEYVGQGGLAVERLVEVVEQLRVSDRQ